MSKFKFRLATLKKLREAARDQRRADLAEALRADEIIDEQSLAVRRALSAMVQECRAASGPGPVDVDRLAQAHVHALVLEGQDLHLARQREAVAGEIEVRREALVQADREVRVLERLEEKQSARHRRGEEYREVRQLDEAGARRAAHGEEPS